MVREKQWVRTLASAVVAALLLAACAGDEDSESSSGTEADDADDVGDTGDTGEGAAEFFEGETVRIVVVYGEGGAFDLIARTVAPVVGDYLDADVVVENMPGAGGLLAMNTVWEEEPDGLTVVFFSGQGVTGAVLGGADGVQFDLLGYEYVARMALEPRILIGALDSEYQSGDDVVGASGLRFASSGPGGSDHIDANVLFEVLGIDGDIVTGYSGSAETALAVASGDVDAASGTLLDRARTVTAGDAQPLLIISDERVDLYPDIPTVLEFELGEEQRALAEAQLALQGMGYTMLAPPGTPEDRVQLLTEAFGSAMSDSGVVERLNEQELVTEGFLEGPGLRDVAESLLNDAPEAFTEILLRAYDAS